MEFMEVELPTASENIVHFELYSDEDGGRPLQLTLKAIDACGLTHFLYNCKRVSAKSFF